MTLLKAFTELLLATHDFRELSNKDKKLKTNTKTTKIPKTSISHYLQM